VIELAEYLKRLMRLGLEKIRVAWAEGLA